ncbi:MAG: DISARM system phospholipase D-like protein DrmC [Acidobacteriota bacterium]|nr:DISARM system phospholipase D-like protein DrmC [Acidobacteriota bacterium]
MSVASLRAIAQALRSGQLGSPLSRLALKRIAPSCSDNCVGQLANLDADGIKPAHLALLVDAAAEAAEARMSLAAELVWTGPETSVAHSRDTSVVLAELFESATRSVMVSTFALQEPKLIFRALADRMAQVPGLKVQLFVHVGRDKRDSRHESEILREFAAKLKADWPGDIRPMLYYDPRSLASNAKERANWHAKVVVVDEETSFVTSANFTEWAQQRNVEAGVLIRNAAFGRQLCQQFESLVQSKAVLEVPGFR